MFKRILAALAIFCALAGGTTAIAASADAAATASAPTSFYHA